MPARAGHSPATVSSSPAKDRHGLASLKTTWAWKSSDAMHSQPPPPVEVEYLRFLRRMSALRGGLPLHRWYLFAGGGISCKLLQVYDAFLLDRYNIEIAHKVVLLAELDTWKHK